MVPFPSSSSGNRKEKKKQKKKKKELKFVYKSPPLPSAAPPGGEGIRDETFILRSRFHTDLSTLISKVAGVTCWFLLRSFFSNFFRGKHSSLLRQTD